MLPAYLENCRRECPKRNGQERAGNGWSKAHCSHNVVAKVCFPYHTSCNFKFLYFRSLRNALCHLLSVFCFLQIVLCLLLSVLCHLFSVLCHLSSVFCPLSSVICPLLSVICLLAASYNPPKPSSEISIAALHPPLMASNLPVVSGSSVWMKNSAVLIWPS